VPRVTLATQNVDGLHRRAGSTRVLELHGDITRTRCSRCRRVADTWRESNPPPPRCETCGGHLRPDVVWFGELLPHDALEEAAAAAEQCDVALVVGTSGLVYPAAGLPRIALAAGALIIAVDPNPTPLDRLPGVVSVRGRAGVVLPDLVESAWA
jgi:NAD-dependent deacetylase